MIQGYHEDRDVVCQNIRKKSSIRHQEMLQSDQRRERETRAASVPGRGWKEEARATAPARRCRF